MAAQQAAPADKWGSRLGFVMAAVGSAVGLGNIWRFPYMAYDNGGGAFMIPYVFAVFTAGIPLMIMEFSLGKRTGMAAPGALAWLGRGGRMLGWWQTSLGFFMMTYYSVVLSWALCYAFFAATGAWGSDPQTFFFESFLHTSSGPMDPGGPVWQVANGALAIWALVWLILWRGVHRGIELACKIFMPVLLLLMVSMLVMSLSLPGAMEGVTWLYRPDFSRLTDFRVWADAYSQVFYSTSVFFAVMIAYSSYLPEDADVNGSAVITVCLNSGFSFLAGTMIFAILGSLAVGRGVPVDQVVGSGISLAFITVPAALDLMPLPRLTGLLFFLSLLVAGLSSLLSMSEAVAAPIIRTTGKARHLVVSALCLVGFLASLLYVWGNGLHLLDVADHFLSNYGLICLGLAELVLFAWISGKMPELRHYCNATSDFKQNRLWDISLRWINTPFLALTVVLLAWDDLSPSTSTESRPLTLLLGGAVIGVTLVAAWWARRLGWRGREE
jgi:NSS family neurotransmitter:Na+ symporter